MSRAIEPLTILIPIYNDWEAPSCCSDAPLAESSLQAGVDRRRRIYHTAASCGLQSYRPLHHIEVLSLRQNLVHQRAIGIAFVENRGQCEALAVMDGDQEDSPRATFRGSRLSRCDNAALGSGGPNPLLRPFRPTQE
jgi:hypothetical protein